MTEPATCPRGCVDTDPDGDCQASLIVTCPLGNWQSERTDESGKFQPCGCLQRERCGGCGHCKNCDGCYCGED
ncbi:hypothetical protein [Amycolatopsis sp. NPDC004378]